MSKRIDKAAWLGIRKGRLVVTGFGLSEPDKRGRQHTTVICQCDCGNITPVLYQNFRRDTSWSCGCIRLTFERATNFNFVLKAFLKYGAHSAGCAESLCSCGYQDAKHLINNLYPKGAIE